MGCSPSTGPCYIHVVATSCNHFWTPKRGAPSFVYNTPQRGLLRTSRQLTLVRASKTGFTGPTRSPLGPAHTPLHPYAHAPGPSCKLPEKYMGLCGSCRRTDAKLCPCDFYNNTVHICSSHIARRPAFTRAWAARVLGLRTEGGFTGSIATGRNCSA